MVMREIPEAIGLDLQGLTTEQFRARVCWRIAGKRGIYRTVAREGRSGLNAGPGNIVAIAPGDQLGEFRLDTDLTEQAGEAFPSDETAAVEAITEMWLLLDTMRDDTPTRELKFSAAAACGIANDFRSKHFAQKGPADDDEK